jgi:hypothetical protein
LFGAAGTVAHVPAFSEYKAQQENTQTEMHTPTAYRFKFWDLKLLRNIAELASMEIA